MPNLSSTTATSRVWGDPYHGWEVTDEELADKYFEYVDGLQAPAEAAAVIDFISRLHEAEDLRDLERLLR